LIIWASVNAFGKIKFQTEVPASDLTFDDLKSWVDKKWPVIINVRGGTHWVLAIGYENDGSVYVHDPGFDTNTYAYSGILNAVAYSV
jgi:hypothetical protein